MEGDRQSMMLLVLPDPVGRHAQRWSCDGQGGRTSPLTLVVRIGKAAVVKSSSHRREPVLPAGRVGPQVLSKVDQGVPRLAFTFEVLEHHGEGGAIGLIKVEYIGWVGGFSWHVSSMVLSARTVHGGASSDDGRESERLPVLSNEPNRSMLRYEAIRTGNAALPMGPDAEIGLAPSDRWQAELSEPGASGTPHRRHRYVTELDDQWREVDDLLYARWIINAIKKAREFCGGLGEATDQVSQRVTYLWATTPERFKLPREGYGSGSYS